MTKEQYIKENIPVQELIEVGFFKPEYSYDDMANRICRFFGLKNVFMYSHIGMDKEEPVKVDLKTFSDN